MTRYRKKSEIKHIYAKIGIFIAILAAGFAIISCILGMADRQSLKNTVQKNEDNKILYQGTAYVPRGNLETYLFAGIDDPGQVEQISEWIWSATITASSRLPLLQCSSVFGRYSRQFFS